MLPCAQKQKISTIELNTSKMKSGKVHDFENNCLMLFKKGQYWNDIRSAYEDLLCIGSLNLS